jgi:hypothetical protein
MARRRVRTRTNVVVAKNREERARYNGRCSLTYSSGETEAIERAVLFERVL